MALNNVVHYDLVTFEIFFSSFYLTNYYSHQTFYFLFSLTWVTQALSLDISLISIDQYNHFLLTESS